MKNKRQGNATRLPQSAPDGNAPARSAPEPAPTPAPGVPAAPAAPPSPPPAPIPNRIMQPPRNVFVRVASQPVSTPDGVRFKTDKPFHLPEPVRRALGGRVVDVPDPSHVAAVPVAL